MHQFEVYKGSQYKVCHSMEEWALLEKKGWSQEKEEGIDYTPIHADGANPEPAKRSPGRPKKNED